MIDTENYRALAVQMREMLDRFPMPGPNELALNPILYCCRSLVRLDPASEPAASRFALLAEAFYSRREHLRFPGGAAAIRGELRWGLVEQIWRRWQQIDKACETDRRGPGRGDSLGLSGP